MKVLQYLVSLVFFLAGVALLVAPLHAAVVPPSVAAQGYVPTRFTVTDAGTVGKPDVILIPGLASSKAVWDGEAKLLAPNYRLHILQVDGFAGAPTGANVTADGVSKNIIPGIVEDLHGYIGATKMHPAVVGHSLGGLVTLMLADKYPADVSKLVIVDSLPFYGVAFDPDATVASMKPNADAIATQMLAMPDDQFAAMQPMMASGMVKNADAQKLVAASGIASDRKVVVEAMVEDLQTDIRGDVANIKTPTLMLYPYDPGLQKDAAKYDAVYHDSYKAMPNVKLVRVDDSRHFIMYDQPGKMDEAVEAFLK